MSENQIANRYARALFRFAEGDLAVAQSHHEALGAIDELFANPEAGKILRSPIMPLDLKKDLLNYGLKTAEADVTLKNFIGTVVDAGRVTILPQVTSTYAGLLDDARGVLEAELISAREMGSGEVSEITAILGEVFNKKVEAKPRVDASLLGGFVVRIGNMLIDFSLKTRLDGLAQSAVR